ncbi:MAG: sulfite exporter TauE/SafE family protein [Candidatus Hydrogenedentota bacterium]
MDTILFGVGMFALGAATGLVNAALGIGGGVLMVPAFLTFVDWMDVNTAKGTSSFIITFVALLNAWQMNRGAARNSFALIASIAAGSIVGAAAAGQATARMTDTIVTWIFISLLAFVGVRTFFLNPPHVLEAAVRTRRWTSLAIGVAAGIVGGGTGTGGGAVLVPLALWAGIVSNERVVALSNSVMVATAASAAIAHALAPSTVDMPWTIGLVNFSLAPLVFLGAVCGAPFGVKLNAVLTLPRRKVVMGVLLLVIAARLVLRVAS